VLEGESGGEWERRRGRAGEWVEVGGEEVEASRGGALTHPRRCRRGGRAASRPCSGAHQGNRKGGRASGSWAGQAGEVGRPAGMGRSPRGGQGLSLPLFFSPFFLNSFSLLFSFLANKDFAKNYAIGQNNLKELLGTAQIDCEALEIVCHFHKLKRHLIYFLGHCLK